MKRDIKGTPIGSRFGRWETIATPYRVGRYTMCLCQCQCGEQRPVNLINVINGVSRSCGCLERELTAKRNFKHGASIRGKRERLYTTWAHMIQRCTDVNDIGYGYYGARGITVCIEWRDFPTFRKWAHENGYQENLTIERKDVNGNYEPENCTWIPRTKQNRNRRDSRMVTAFGVTKGIADWVEDKRCAIPITALRSRLDREWNPEAAISEPKCHRWSRRPKAA